METGSGGESMVAASEDQTELLSGATQSVSHTQEEVTQIESKTTMVVVQSESSHMTTSTLSTEAPLPLSGSPLPTAADDAPSGKPDVPPSPPTSSQAEEAKQEESSSPSEEQKNADKNGEVAQSNSMEEDLPLPQQEEMAKEEQGIVAPPSSEQEVTMSEPVEQQQKEEEKTSDVPAELPAQEKEKAADHQLQSESQLQSQSQVQRDGSSSAEIQEGSVKDQLQEIIKEIDLEVGQEEEGPHHHTWQPKGNYELEKTEVKHEEIVPVEIPDVAMKEREAQEAQEAMEAEQKSQMKSQVVEASKEEISLESLKVLRHTVMSGEPISPLEIPAGIPLLARVLPRDSEEEQHEKIPLQRLFTPATDAGEIVPHKKKAFASSCFYRPDHPTIDDQVELAHKISVSLVDENNKTSKGQNMYMKRKNRSSKWVHQGEEAEMLAASQFEMEQDAQQDKMPVKPALKLLMNPKGAMHDFNSMQQHEEHHSEELKASSQTTQAITRMEVGMEIASNLESPTGKGAALFAKRKKRMDKFIVDETTVQHQSPSSSSSFSAAADQSTETTMQVSSTSAMQQQQHSSFSSTTTQQGQQQLSTQFNQTMLPQINGPSSTQMPAINQPGALHQLPELSQILTQPQPFEKTPSSLPSRSSGRSKPASSRSHSADSKPFSHFNSPSSQKPKEKSQRRERENKKGVSFGPFSASYNNIAQEIQDPLIDVRPGSPPVFLVPDGTGEFIERKPEVELFNHINETTEATTNNGTTMNTNEATKNAINCNFSGLHSFIAPEAYSSAAFQKSEYPLRPSSPFQKQTHTPPHNSLNVSLEAVGSISTNKRARPNSLPLIPLVDFNAPSLVSLNSFSPLTPFSCTSSTFEKHGFSPRVNAENLFASEHNHLLAKTNHFNSKPELSNNLENYPNNLQSVNIIESPLFNPKYSMTSEGPKYAKVFRPKELLPNHDQSPISSTVALKETEDINEEKEAFFNTFTNVQSSKQSNSCISQTNNAWESDTSPLYPIIYSTFIAQDTLLPAQPVLCTEENNTSYVDRISISQLQFNGNGTEAIDGRDTQVLINMNQISNDEANIKQDYRNVEKKMKSILDDLENMIVTEAETDIDLREDYDSSRGQIDTVEEGAIEDSKLKRMAVELELKDSLLIKELNNFISGTQETFSTSPTILKKIDPQDFQPSECFTSICSPTNDRKKHRRRPVKISPFDKDEAENEFLQRDPCVDALEKNKKYIWIGNAEKVISETKMSSDNLYASSSSLHDTTTKQNVETKHPSVTVNTDSELSSTSSHFFKDTINTPFVQPNKHLTSSSTVLPNPKLENFAKHSETKSYPWSAEGGAIYTAEVKVVQNTSLPTTPVIDFSVSNPSTCSILDNLPMSKEEDKRKSFNLAPKGWGTYNNFYTPVHLEAR